jgi:hypothetical protein
MDIFLHYAILAKDDPVNSYFLQQLGIDQGQLSNYEPGYFELLKMEHTGHWQIANSPNNSTYVNEQEFLSKLLDDPGDGLLAHWEGAFEDFASGINGILRHSWSSE